MYVVAVCEFGGTQRTPLGRLVDSQFTTWFGFMASSEGAGAAVDKKAGVEPRFLIGLL